MNRLKHRWGVAKVDFDSGVMEIGDTMLTVTQACESCGCELVQCRIIGEPPEKAWQFWLLKGSEDGEEAEPACTGTPYRRNRALGLCGFCKAPAEPGRSVCANHRRTTPHDPGEADRRRAAGMCPMCGARPPREGKSLCEKCGERQVDNQTLRRGRLASEGRCRVCGGENDTGTARCVGCKAKRSGKAPFSIEFAPDEAAPGKDPTAVELGRAGGLKGGPARAAALSPEARSEISSLGGKARWEKKAAARASALTAFAQKGAAARWSRKRKCAICGWRGATQGRGGERPLTCGVCAAKDKAAADSREAEQADAILAALTPPVRVLSLKQAPEPPRPLPEPELPPVKIKWVDPSQAVELGAGHQWVKGKWCEECAGLSFRRPKAGCPVCHLPYEEERLERPGGVKSNAGGLGEP